MNTILGLALILTALFLIAVLLTNRRARQSKPLLVEQYTITIGKLAGAPPKLQLTFHDETGASSVFLFSPAYAHHLSDELCQASALAVRPSEGVFRGES